MKSAEEFLSFIRVRRSIRLFADKPVPKDTLCKLIEAARWAPSAGNRQDWLFTVVTSAEVKQKMAEAVRRRWKEISDAHQDRSWMAEVAAYAESFTSFVHAPVVIVVSARRPNSVYRRLLGDDAAATVGGFASAAMAAQNLMLGAQAVGLGSCCMTGALAARDELAHILGLGRREEIVCLVAAGLPAETPPAPARKPLGEIARFLE